MIVHRRAKEMREERMRMGTVTNTTQIMSAKIGTMASLVWKTEWMMVIAMEVVIMKLLIYKEEMINNLWACSLREAKHIGDVCMVGIILLGLYLFRYVLFVAEMGETNGS